MDFVDKVWERSREKQIKRIQQLQLRDDKRSKSKEKDEDRMASVPWSDVAVLQSSPQKRLLTSSRPILSSTTMTS